MIPTVGKESTGGKKTSGSSTSSTTNVTAGPNPALSGQRPVTILSHAWPLKTESLTRIVFKGPVRTAQ